MGAQMGSSNWAEEYGSTVETRSEFREHGRKQRAQERAVRKALQERDYLYKEWKTWHEKQLKEFLNSDYAAAASELHSFLLTAGLDSGDELIELVRRGPWREADEDTRYQVLRMINHAVVYLRENNGMEPFDDPLDDDLNVFLQIRRLLAGW
jgi:hypothetical protein